MTETVNISITKIDKSKLDQVDFANIQFGKTYSDHVFIADYDGEKWKDFRIEPYDYLRLSPASPALHYGESVFEGMKAYKGSSGEILIFRPDENFKRLNISGERICMPALPEEVFMEGLKTLVSLDKGWVPDLEGTALYVRPFIFSSDEYIGIRPSDNFTFMIITCPVGAYYSKPVKVKIETHYTRAAPGGTGYAKAAGNYAGSLYPARLAQQQGYDQLIWTDSKEHIYIEESGTMNVMFVIDNVLITPPTGDTILNGITRKSVLRLARDWDMKVEERKIAVQEVVEAIEAGRLQEAFGTGTAATIAHIDTLAHEGKDHKLPPVADRVFSTKVLKTLDGIKTGMIPDKHDWVYQL